MIFLSSLSALDIFQQNYESVCYYSVSHKIFLALFTLTVKFYIQSHYLFSRVTITGVKIILIFVLTFTSSSVCFGDKSESGNRLL
jgi:ABC-type maltose transport system permease subunit